MVDTDVARMDPAEVAPPLVVPVDAGRDAVGHGRNLPLVGQQRPHVYDVVYDGGRQRVYADTVDGVLSAFVDGYQQAVDEVAAAESSGDQDQMQAALAAAFQARYAHAAALRVELQQTINTRAQTTGTWDTLDEEEVEQCTQAALGQIPVGVLYEVPLDNPDGSSVIVDKGFWTHPDVPLVLNRGDYDLFDPDFTPEPESLLSETDEQGRDVVYGGRWPDNLVLLDPTDADAYVETLEHADLIDVTIRPVDLPDDVYLRAVQMGKDILDAPQQQDGEYGQENQ